ncbi:unnamed protein product [Camellia sinensis]
MDRELWLHNNSFTHQIPPELGHLRRLRILKLGNNSITGEIPANISACSNLLTGGYGTGNELMTLEMFTRKRPTDNLFNDNLSLHNFVMMALPEQALLIQHYFNEEKLGSA